MTRPFQDRISFKGELKVISEAVCEEFSLGEFKSNKIIPVGYEDFNFILETSKGKFFVKVLADFRDLEDCKSYVSVIKAAIKAGIKTPKLLKSKQGELALIELDDALLRVLVLEFIDGKDMYSLGNPVLDEDVIFVAQQAAKINSLDIKPRFIYDQWACVHFPKEFEKKKDSLPPEDLAIVEPMLKEFNALDIENLPHCYVHGDLLKGNVIRDKDGQLWVIDFAVGNFYPRIQELAVLGCDICFEKDNKENSERKFKLAVEEYQKIVKLTPRELEILPLYLKLAHVMHVILSNYERKELGNHSKENDYFLEIGQAGLRQMRD
ncbi:MAG: phosphotransferase [archaeon]